MRAGYNKLFIASAGSGKTSHLINEALKIQTERCLITTFTLANENQIRQRIIKENKFIPENITIQTWFSFLLQHGVKPYQGQMIDKKIRGMQLVSGQSSRFIGENTNIEGHYFNSGMQIYSDKIAKFVYKCNEKCNGLVVDRLSKIYPNIFIDEVQDLAGYDLELLKLLFKSSSNVLMVGDPRQGTYSTNNSPKKKQYKRGDIIHFFEDHTNYDLDIDNNTLITNWRSNQLICDFSNSLYPDLPKTNSGSIEQDGHQGIFFVKSNDIESYLKQFGAMQLRYDIKTAVNNEYEVRNFGDSKGLEFDRVLIYPTAPMKKWILDKTELAKTSKSKFYVAITRAKHSVGIVYDYSNTLNIEGIKKFY